MTTPLGPRYGPPPPPGAYAGELADDARVALGRLRTVWGWLGDARVPGPPATPVDRPTRVRDYAALAAAVAEHDADRQAALEAYRHRRSGIGAHPVPVRLAVVEARAAAALEVTGLVTRLWRAAYDGGLLLAVVEAEHRPITIPCTWCGGTGHTQRPPGWHHPVDEPVARALHLDRGGWPTERITCPRCHNGRVPAPRSTCPGCAAPGRCRCDRADVIVGLSLSAIGELLDVADVEAAADADTTLHDVAEMAERAVGCGPDRRRLPGNPPPTCPVCASRELHADVTSPDRREWSIRCYGPDCVCYGLDCPCGIGTPRRRDRRHLWPARRWDGPDGLVTRLGVDLAALVGARPHHTGGAHG